MILKRNNMDRVRISITLKPSLLERLDQQIDGMQIRNRSHAIEYYLSQALQLKIRRVAILAGGRGRIREGREIASALVQRNGRPLLEHSFDLLHRFGLSDVTLAIGHLGDQIRQRYLDGSRFGLKIGYSDQQQYTGTGGALRALRWVIPEEPFLVLHGDIRVDIDLDDLINFHLEHEYAITLALTSVSDPSQYGSVQVRRSQVVSFSEKPDDGEKASNLINAGVYVVSPEFLREIPDLPYSSIEKDVLPKLAAAGRVGAYVFDGSWESVG